MPQCLMGLHINQATFDHLQIDLSYAKSIPTLYVDFVDHTTLYPGTTVETKEITSVY